MKEIFIKNSVLRQISLDQFLKIMKSFWVQKGLKKPVINL